MKRRLNKQKSDNSASLDPTAKLLELLGSVKESREKNRLDELFQREILADKVNNSNNSIIDYSYFQKASSDISIKKNSNNQSTVIKHAPTNSIPKQNINEVSLDQAEKFLENRRLMAKENKFKQRIDAAAKDIGESKKFLDEIEHKYSDDFINFPDHDLSFSISSNFNSDPTLNSRSIFIN